VSVGLLLLLQVQGREKAQVKKGQRGNQGGEVVRQRARHASSRPSCCVRTSPSAEPPRRRARPAPRPYPPRAPAWSVRMSVSMEGWV
jgi:hypothetical protein